MKRLLALGEASLWIIALAAVVLGCLGLSMGFDVWFHLLNGAQIITAGEIPHHDHWLIPLADLPSRFFPNYEWLFGLIIQSAWQYGGYTAVDLLRGVLILTTFGFVAAASWRRAAASPVARVLTPALLLLAFAAASGRFEPRPQIVSSAGLALMTLLVRMPAMAGAILLVPVALFWANCHIEILFGIGYAAIWLLPSHQPGEGRGETLKFNILYLLILIAAVALSPAGPHLIGQAGSYYEGERMIRAMGFWNVELVGLTFDPQHPAAFLFILIATIALILRTFRKKRLFDPETLSAAAFILLPFISSRYILPGVVILTPFLAGIPGDIASETSEAEPTPMPLITGALAMVLVLWLAPSAFLPGNPSRPHGSGCAAPPEAYNAESEFPDAALRFLTRNGIGGQMFTHDKWGNFVAFYDNPCQHHASAIRRKPFMNAMFQTMPWQRIERYLNAILNETAWHKLCADADIETVLLPYPENASDPWHPFMQRISFNAGWKLVWWDDTGFAYVASTHPYLQKGGKPFSAARPDQWLVTGTFPESAPVRAAALAEMAEIRGLPEGSRVIRTLQWMAGLMMKSGDATSTILLLESEGEKIAPRNKHLNALLGEAYGRAARWNEAYERLSLSAREPASSAALFYNLAVAAAHSERLPEARAALERCLACDPLFGQAVELKRIIAE